MEYSPDRCHGCDSDEHTCCRLFEIRIYDGPTTFARYCDACAELLDMGWGDAVAWRLPDGEWHMTADAVWRLQHPEQARFADSVEDFGMFPDPTGYMARWPEGEPPEG